MPYNLISYIAIAITKYCFPLYSVYSVDNRTEVQME